MNNNGILVCTFSNINFEFPTEENVCEFTSDYVGDRGHLEKNAFVRVVKNRSF